MAINAFRLVTFSAVALIVWFAFFNNNDHLQQRSRRAPTAQPVSSYCVNSGQVAITIDEGPSDVTKNVLTTLNSLKIKATFHIITKYFAADVTTITNLQLADQAGHLIGLRWPTNLNATTMTDDAIVQTLIDESNKIYSFIKKYPKFIRLSYNEYNDHIVALVQQQGFIITTWNIDTVDYKQDVTVDGIVTAYNFAMQKNLPGSARFIAIHHDLYPIYNTPDAFTAVNNAIVDNGYTAVTLDKCMNQASGYRASNNDLRGAGDGSGTAAGGSGTVGGASTPSTAASTSIGILFAAVSAMIVALMF